MDRIRHASLRVIIGLPMSIFLVSGLIGPVLAAGAANTAPAGDASSEMDHSIAEILSHPMFTPGRQPPVTPATAAAEPPKPPEIEGRLAGIVIRSGIREAMIAREGDEPLIVKEGDDLNGWTVSSISLKRVVVKSEFGEHVLEMTAAQSGEGPRKIGRAINKRPPLARRKTQTPAPSSPQPIQGGANPRRRSRQAG